MSVFIDGVFASDIGPASLRLVAPVNCRLPFFSFGIGHDLMGPVFIKGLRSAFFQVQVLPT